MRFDRLVLALLSIGSCAFCPGDTLTLADGSRLVGKVLAIHQGRISIETGFAGTLSVALEQVVAMQADEPLCVSLPQSGKVEGAVSIQNGEVSVQTAHGLLRGPLADLAAAGPVGLPLPGEAPPAAEKPKPKWAYEFSGQYRGKSGNTDSTRLGLGATAVLQRDKDRLKAYANWARTEENGRTTEDQIIGGLDYERELAKLHSWYVRAELERDDIERVSLRATVASGYGFYPIKKEHQELRLRSGLVHRSESYDNGREDNDSIGIEFGLMHRWDIADWGRLVTDVTYSPTFEDWADYRILHETSLDVPLAKSKVWSLRLGLSHEYNSIVAPGVERLDTTYFARLVFSYR